MWSARRSRAGSRASRPTPVPAPGQSGGQVIETVTHQVDLLRLLAGEVRTVCAFGGIRSGRGRGPEDIFDVQSVAFLFESGAVGSLACNLLTPQRHQWQVDIAREGLDVELRGDRLRVVDQNGEQEWPMDDHEPLLAESTAFMRASGGRAALAGLGVSQFRRPSFTSRKRPLPVEDVEPHGPRDRQVLVRIGAGMSAARVTPAASVLVVCAGGVGRPILVDDGLRADEERRSRLRVRGHRQPEHVARRDRPGSARRREPYAARRRSGALRC